MNDEIEATTITESNGHEVAHVARGQTANVERVMFQCSADPTITPPAHRS